MNVKMSDVEAAYIAGLMDGEGCFTVVKSKADNTPIKTQYGIRIEFCMCDRGPIELMASLFGRPISTKVLKSGRTAYLVRFHAATAIAFTEAVLPHLRGKKRQAELVLEMNRNLPGRGRSHTEESVAVVERIRAELHGLKRAHLLRC